MRRSPRPCPLALFVLLLLAAAPAVLAQAPRYSRALEVPRPGWVQVPLSQEVLRQRATVGGSFLVFGPQGEELPVRRVPVALEGRRRAVEVVGVEERPGGWWLRIDVGPQAGEGRPLRHDRLIFDLANRTLARGVRLEASADGESWDELTTGDLFRLGEGEGLAETALAYPATGRRYLRLRWPRRAGYPEVRRVEVELESPRAPRFGSVTPECEELAGSPGGPGAGARGRSCRLDLVGIRSELRRLELVMRSSGPVGYRLLAPDDGRWRVVADGVWRGGGGGGAEAEGRSAGEPGSAGAEGEEPGEGSLAISLSRALGGEGWTEEGRARPVETLQLELWSAAEDELPEVLAWSVGFEAEALVFRAPAAGRYTLAYGPGWPAVVGRGELPPGGEEPILVAVGPEEEGVGDPALPTAGGPLPDVRFEAAWTVTTPETDAPSGLYRLEVPPEVYDRSQGALGHLRLAYSGAQVPWVRRRPEVPRQVMRDAVVPQRSEASRSGGRGGGRSSMEITLAEEDLPLSSLTLTAWGARFERRVAVLYQEPMRAGEAARFRPATSAGSVRWECRPRPPLPCRLDIPLDMSRAEDGVERLLVEIEDGDDAPLRRVDLALWRHRDLLLFFWPKAAQGDDGAEERVELVLARELPTPSYDLGRFEAELLQWPAQQAELGDPGAELAEDWGRWVLLGSLILAGLVLLLLLDRILREGARQVADDPAEDPAEG